MEAGIRAAALLALKQLGLPEDELDSASESVARTRLSVPDAPFIPTPFKVTELVAGLNTAVLALANRISTDRIGREQETAVDAEHATATMTSHFTCTVDDLPSPASLGAIAAANPGKDIWGKWRGIMGHHYACADGRYIVFLTRPLDTPDRCLAALGFDEIEVSELVSLLDTENGRMEHFHRLSAKIASWNSAALEERIITTGATAGIVGLSQEDFLTSPHGRIASKWPGVLVEKVEAAAEGVWPACPWTRLDTVEEQKKGILAGVRVLEFTRILLGPRTGCLLAALGATVIRINSARIEEGGLAVDVNSGHHSIFLDLKKDEDRRKFHDLLDGCDVLISNNTPGVADKLGWGFTSVLSRLQSRPKGIVYAEATCFGHDGPLATAPGYEQLGQFVSGLAETHGRYHKYAGTPIPGRPALIPINVLDICTAHLFGLAIIRALDLRARKGGSYRVRTSLLQGAMTLQRLGLYPRELVDAAWSNYEGEPVEFDSERAFGGGSVGWFCGFQCVQLPARYPDAFKKEYYQSMRGTPWLAGADRTVNIVRPALWMDATPAGYYRVATRPMGWDRAEEVDWESAEKSDLDMGEDGSWRFTGRSKR